MPIKFNLNQSGTGVSLSPGVRVTYYDVDPLDSQNGIKPSKLPTFIQ